jgi:hypothetical protein
MRASGRLRCGRPPGGRAYQGVLYGTMFDTFVGWSIRTYSRTYTREDIYRKCFNIASWIDRDVHSGLRYQQAPACLSAELYSAYLWTLEHSGVSPSDLLYLVCRAGGGRPHHGRCS